MKSAFKKHLKRIARGLGFDLVRYLPDRLGIDSMVDMKRLIKADGSPVIIDVGANIGQSAVAFSEHFPTAKIHSFEPGPVTFRKLVENCAGRENIKCWNHGVGAENRVMEFIENDHSTMSSFLNPGRHAWGEVTGRTEVSVVTLDSFAENNNIDRIHILKTDTQGYDLQVLKGARSLMSSGRIAMVHSEIIFSEMYEGMPPVHELLSFMHENDFVLATLYDFCYRNEGLASWTDGLFVRKGLAMG